MLPRRRIRRFRKTTKTKPRTLLPALALAVAATARARAGNNVRGLVFLVFRNRRIRLRGSIT